MMGQTEFGDKKVGAYSGGMIRRLGIAQSTLHRLRFSSWTSRPSVWTRLPGTPSGA
jgi:hypothetical protein